MTRPPDFDAKDFWWGLALLTAALLVGLIAAIALTPMPQLIANTPH